MTTITQKELDKILRDNPNLKVQDSPSCQRGKQQTGKGSCIIEIVYIGSCLSVNHYKYAGGRYTRKETKEWMEYLGFLLPVEEIQKYKLPLTVRCDALFRDRRSSCDISNLCKVVMDAIMHATGIDDKHFKWVDGNSKTGTKEPKLFITISENKEG